jgi:hypothetical protein
MKKNSEEYLERQARIARHRLQAYLRKNKAHKQSKKPEALATILNRTPFQFNKICSFSEKNIDASLANLSALRSLIEKHQRVLLDFSETQSISATYGVYLYSELQQLLEEHGSNCIYINLQSLSQHLRFIIKESGILSLTNNVPLSAGKKGFLPIICGKKDDEIDAIINFIINIAELNGHLDRQMKAQAELLTSRAITEAMLNVDYHAYPDLGVDKLWWFTATILEGDLYISICDRGVGIQNTLPRSDWWERAMGLLPINDDAQMIQAAMTYTRTSNKNRKGRGLGTKDMQNLVLEREKGFLTIISGRGHYTLDGNRQGQETLFKLNAPVGGTVINWRIPLENTK